MPVARRERRRQRDQRPEDQSAEDHRLASEAIAHQTGKRSRRRVDPHERRGDIAELHVAQVHLRLEEREDRKDGLTVRVVKQAHEPQQAHDCPFVSAAFVHDSPRFYNTALYTEGE